MQKQQERKEIISDGEIVELYWNREEEAIPQTDEKYGSYLGTVAYHILSDREETEDAKTDTYLKAWNSIPPTRPAVLPAFLTRIIRNTSFDYLRKNSASKRVPSQLLVALDELEEAAPLRATAEEDMMVRDVARILNEFLNDIPKNQEAMFVMRYYYSDKLADIGKMFGVSIATVTRELASLRRMLAERLRREGYLT